MVIIINNKVQIYSYTEHYNIQIIIYMNGISINRPVVGGGDSVGNMYKIIIIQQQISTQQSC